MKDCYRKSQALPGPDELVEFESNEIKLDIPLEGITLEAGWKITPLTVPVVRAHFGCFMFIFAIVWTLQVRRRLVDSYRPGKRIPRCHLSALFLSDEANIPALQYQVKLVGAREPYTMIAIELPAHGSSNREGEYALFPCTGHMFQ